MTLNPQPSTLNFQPSTLNPQPSALSPQTASRATLGLRVEGLGVPFPDFIAVSIQFKYDPDELATKITTQLVHTSNSKTYV